MAERKSISYAYKSPEDYEKQNDNAHKIIREDTGKDVWPETRSYPPHGIPPPLTPKAIDELKALHGLIVHPEEE